MTNNSDQPLISIIIPVYNRQSGLDSLLSKLSRLIMEDSFESLVEVIVIDDYSTPPVFVIEYPFVVLLERNNMNSGAPFSRKRGFELSRGEFIHFHDSDDSFSDNWLRDILRELDKRPKLDILMTGRIDYDKTGKVSKYQRYFHKNVLKPQKIKSRLVYRNCMGPLGGVVFARWIVEKIQFKPFLSCQDWQMYIDAVQHARVLSSRPDIHFIFNKAGDDRISHDASKKLLGHLQLAKITAPKSPFKKNIRLFYLYSCKQHIFKKGGLVLSFYRKNRFRIILAYLLISVYWRVT